MTMEIRYWIMMLAALMLPTLTSAQPMIDRVPDDAMVYVGWRGADDMGEDYEGSHLQGVVELTGLMDALPQITDALNAFADEEMNEEEADLVNAGAMMWEKAWSGGAAMYILPPLPADPDQPGPPPIPRIAVLWNGAANDGELREALAMIVGFVNEMGMAEAFFGDIGDTLFMSVGFDPGEDAPANGLSANADYQTAAGQVQPDAALTVYVNVQQLLKIVDDLTKQQRQMAEEWGEEPDEMVQMWPTLRDVSGLGGVNRAMITAGIKDKSWQTQMFLEAPAPRKGVLTLIDNDPIEDARLHHIPKTTTYLQALTMDPAKAMDVAYEIMSALDESLVEEFDEMLAEAEEEVGIDFEAQLIDVLGPYWTIYIDPMVSGNSLTSLVLVNELRDADELEKTLNKLTEMFNEVASDELDLDNEPVSVKMHRIEMDGETVTYLGIPFIAPCWMVHDDKLYIALFPQALEMALAHSGKAEDSILANPTFQSTMARLGDVPRTGLSFSDLPASVAEGYGMNLLLVQAIAGLAEMVNEEPSAMRLPPVGKLMPFIEPAGAAMWVDDLGLHITSLEPFPASGLLGPGKGMGGTLMVSGPLAVGIMLPALGSAREAAREAEQLSQVREITLAAQIYAADNKDQLPEDIAQLEDYGATWDNLISPSSLRAQDRPFNHGEWDRARQQRFIRENSSYVLVPLGNLGRLDRPSETVLVFQRPDDNPASDGLVVGWADGHVTMEYDQEWIQQLLEDQAGKTMDELIQRQENFAAEQ